jgi:predicted double-glycine peptidase
MAENKPKSSEELIKQALDYATGSNSLENHILTVEELKQIERDVNAGKGDRSFLMAVLEYVRIKKAEQQVLVGEGVSSGRLKK